jgi:hypothetical protein
LLQVFTQVPEPSLGSSLTAVKISLKKSKLMRIRCHFEALIQEMANPTGEIGGRGGDAK